MSIKNQYEMFVWNVPIIPTNKNIKLYEGFTDIYMIYTQYSPIS